MTLRRGLVVLLLAAASVAVFWPITGHDFINCDDQTYLTQNVWVKNGLSPGAVRWACTSLGYASNWHPLTWLSLQLDAQLFGLRPGWHHAENLGWHAADAILLFLLLDGMTGALWPAALVALLFAVHPLHVESVAWAAERKDVLSTFFWMLTLLCYFRYARRPGPGRFLPVFAALALGLLAKPMLVSLPLVLLVLDWWPLGRAGRPAAATVARPSRLFPLLVEKAPLFLLAAASGIVTMLAQQRGGALRTLAILPLGARAATAVTAAALYLWKMVWPRGLAILYPHPLVAPPSWHWIAALLLLAAISGLAIRLRRSHPSLLAGWAWYLVTLLPVSGLVQVGGQFMADRYTYVPITGVFIALAWGLGDLTAGRPPARRLLAAGLLAAIVALGVAARIQVSYWSDSVTLFSRALAVTRKNTFSEFNLGLGYYQKKDYEGARVHFLEVLGINPLDAEAQRNLGNVYLKTGRPDEALRSYREAYRIDQANPDTLFALANLLASRGELTEAERLYREALRLRPDSSDTLMNLATVLSVRGRPDEAVALLEEAVRLNPSSERARYNLGFVRWQRGETQRAIVQFREALRLKPDDALARQALGQAQSGMPAPGPRFSAQARSGSGPQGAPDEPPAASH